MWRLVYGRIDAAYLRGRPEPAARAAVWAAETEPPAKAAAWLEIVLSAADLVTWTRLLGLAAHRELARAEIATVRYGGCTSRPAPSAEQSSDYGPTPRGPGPRSSRPPADHPHRFRLKSCWNRSVLSKTRFRDASRPSLDIAL